MGNINRTEYKALDNLLWDTRKTYITPKDAFALYERRWAYVDKNGLDQSERDLINMLTEQVGNGHFMPVAS